MYSFLLWVNEQMPLRYLGNKIYRGHKQGVSLCKYLKFGYLRVLSRHEWLRAGALYGNVTLGAILIFLFPICISSTG